MTVKTFSELLREELSNNYRDKSFSIVDLSSFAKKHKRTDKSVIDIFYTLWNNDLLEIVGKVYRKSGGKPSSVYKIVEGADLRLLNCVQRKRNFLNQEEMKLKKQIEACARLNKALDGMYKKDSVNQECPFCGKVTIDWSNCFGCGATSTAMMQKRYAT